MVRGRASENTTVRGSLRSNLRFTRDNFGNVAMSVRLPDDLQKIVLEVCSVQGRTGWFLGLGSPMHWQRSPQCAVSPNCDPPALAVRRIRLLDSIEETEVLTICRECHGCLTPKRENIAVRSVNGDDSLVVDHGDPIAQFLRRVHEVSDEHDGGPLIPHPPHEIPGNPSRHGIDPGGHLVEEPPGVVR